MSERLAPYQFKFHWLDSNGSATTVFRKKGEFDNGLLTLEESEIPAAAIIQTQCEQNRMLIIVATGADDVANLLIQVGSQSVAKTLKNKIDVARSRSWADATRKELEAAGRGASYRDATCPHCTATLQLTDMKETPQVYCHFCDSLCTVSHAAPQGEDKFSLCEECGMYSQPQRYTIFYFVFLIVVYWFRSGTAKKCRGCMRSDAWQMLLANLIFILGVPNAIYQLVRSYSGGALVEGAYAGLNSANVAARGQKWDAATSGYARVLESVGTSAGVKYNMGLALKSAGRNDQAARSFELALGDCSNYVPAYQHLMELYPALGELDKQRALAKQWGDDIEQPTAAQPTD